jgi:hypothetical protein
MDFHIDKYLWTTSDFEELGWHDCTIYKIRIDTDLEMDIDYILKWNSPDIDGLPFTFWISPATLVFRSISNLKMDLEDNYKSSIEIDYIEMEGSGDSRQWDIATQNGLIQFKSTGFEQYIRQKPFFEFSQTIAHLDRGGFSLERTINQENKNRYLEESVQRRARDFENYELVKKRHLANLELSELLVLRENAAIDAKTYLTKQRELQDVVYSCDHFLKRTRFEEW